MPEFLLLMVKSRDTWSLDESDKREKIGRSDVNQVSMHAVFSRELL
jgi:hypothetical protein